jgi:hypothetical protein
MLPPAQVYIDNGLVPPEFVNRTLSEYFALVKDDHQGFQPVDESHVMLDNDNHVTIGQLLDRRNNL